MITFQVFAGTEGEEKVGADVARSLFGTGESKGLILLERTVQEADPRIAKDVMDRIVKPRFHGWKVEDLTVANQTTHGFATILKVVSRSGERASLTINFHRYRGGVAVFLPRMMEIAWEFEGARNNRTDLKAVYWAVANGLQKDQGILREIGLRKFWYHKEEVTISSLLSEYRTRAHRTPGKSGQERGS
ncbi:MAG: hypothetical protein KIS66_10000 [Fimbriimonadaceae bacterium]|nr:hypothetical protein [Fimbriimonadaceae bacterium]